MKLDKYNFQCNEFNIIGDVWMCGSQEKSQDKEKKFSGAYPAGFLKRLKTAFKEYYPRVPDNILHVCSGRIDPSEGVRLDIDEEYNPDILSNAEDMFEINEEAFEWVMADPPYNEAAAKKYYNKKLLNKSKMMREMARVCKRNGFVALLDQTSPNSVPKCLERVALVGVTSIPNQDMRIFSVWRKVCKFGKTPK